jgi:3-oxoacyl-[acyl-carrier-protein] synthase II
MSSYETAINGIGIISAAGTDVRSVRERVIDGAGRHAPKQSRGTEFEPGVPPQKLRRVNRYSRLAVAAAVQALNDAGKSDAAFDPFRAGTVFTTGYGSMSSNIAFGMSVADGEPDRCSPSLFAGTVANACVGQVCIQLNLRGPSTVLIGGNVFLYAKLLLETDRADIIFAGAVEEYDEDLFASLGENKTASEIRVNEATAVFVLGRRNEASYCVVGQGSSAALAGYPLVKRLDEAESERAMRLALRECLDKNEGADVVISSANGSYFDDIEARAIEAEAPGAEVADSVKGFFGETMGAAFSIGAAAGSLCLRDRRFAEGLGVARDPEKILVTGYDPIGNYNCVVLSKNGGL